MNLPSVPSVPSNIDPQLWQVLNAIKTNIDYAQANPATATAGSVDQAQLATAVAKAMAGVTAGQTGATGATGATASTYVLDISGGRTSVIYDASGANPLPTMTPFTAVLYKDGNPVTSNILYNWYIAYPATSLLSGSGNADTFTPTLASTFDPEKPDNTVALTVYADNLTFSALEPLAITKIGATGSTGATGTSGVSLYTWLKYADTPTTGMADSPAGKAYLGIAYNQTDITESNNYADYQWSLITGTDGLPGTPGTDGVTKYTWVKYATNANGTTGFSDSPTDCAYIGLAFNKDTATESNIPADYAWSLIQGATGVAGNRTAVLDVYQYSLTEPITFPSGNSTYTWSNGQFDTTNTTLNGWSVVPTSPVLGQTLWLARTIYADNNTSETTEITWTTATALAMSVSGANGRRNAELQLFQWSSTVPTTFPSGTSDYTWATGLFTDPSVTLNGWTVDVGTSTPGQTLYTCYAHYSDDLIDAVSTVTWPSINSALPAGAAGANGQRTGILEVYQWAASAPTPPAGTSTYTWATGVFTLPSTANGWSLLPGASTAGFTLWGIRTAVANNLTDASSIATWSSTTPYAVGKSGSNGINGKTYLLFITGGKTNAVYDTNGANPVPAQTAFSCELYQDGVLVTPTTRAWSTPVSNSLLSGSATTATFTPTLATAFNADYGDNLVLLTVTYVTGGVTFTLKAVQPIAITKQVLATVDTTPPVAIGGTLSVTGGVLYNYLTWGTLPGNFDHVEIWRSTANDRNGAGTDAIPLGATLIGTSVFTVYADYLPAGVNVLNYYWIRAISKAGIAGAWNTVSDNGTSATAVGITDSQVSSISASKIVANYLAAITANLGDVTAGTLTSGDAMFKIDLVTKSIIMGNGTNNPGSVSPWYGSQYILIQAGDITTYVWNGSVYKNSKSLRVLEAGVAINGNTVTLSDYYYGQPKIIVSPNNIQCHKGANSTQDQSLIIAAENITVTNGVCTFVPKAMLALAANISTTTICNNQVTSTSDAAINSAQYVTQANSTSITCSINLISTKGTGTAPLWKRRQVTARIWYGTASGSYPSAGAPVTIVLSADKNTNAATVTATGLAAGTYYFVVQYYSADAAGYADWSDGATQYDYLYETVNLVTGGTAFINNTTGTVSTPVSCTFAAAPSHPGYTITGAVYTFAYVHWIRASATNYFFGTATASILNTAGSAFRSVTTTTTNYVTDGGSGTIYTMTYSGAWSQTLVGGYASVRGYVSGSWPATGYASLTINPTGSTAYLTYRKTNTNTTAISNSFTLNNFYTAISGTSALATGTLNYMAIL